jgi:hypothetical protein
MLGKKGMRGENAVSRFASLPVEVVFAVIAAVFGVAFAVTMPPLSPPDEVRHLARA